MSDIATLLDLQAGTIARSQALSAGLSANDVRRLIRRREWVVTLPGVCLDHTGEPSWLQRAWAAVLYAGPRAALSHESAVRAAEGPGRPGDDGGVIHVAVEHRRRVTEQEGLIVHRTRFLDDRVQWQTSPPCVRYEEALLDLAAETTSRWDRIELVSRACRSRRTTAGRLRASLSTRSRVPERAWLQGLLSDVDAGACSVLEHAYLVDVERAHGLPTAVRQRAVPTPVGLT